MLREGEKELLVRAGQDEAAGKEKDAIRSGKNTSRFPYSWTSAAGSGAMLRKTEDTMRSGLRGCPPGLQWTVLLDRDILVP